MENTLSVKIQLAIKDFVNKSREAKREYKKSVDGMSTAAQSSGRKINSAFENLATRSTKDINREIQKLRASYNRLERDGTTSVKDLARAQQSLQEKTKELRREQNGLTASLGDVRVQAALVAGSLVILARQLLTTGGAYVEFNKGMAEVNTLLGLNRDGIDSLSNSVRQLSRDTGTEAQVNTAALYDIISAGAEDSTEANELLAESIKAAIAGVSDTKTAAATTTSVLNAYNLEAANAREVNDLLFTTIKGGVVTFDQLAQNIGNVLSTAVGADVPLTELTASLASLTKVMRAPIATTALRGAINALNSPGEGASKVLAEYGIEWKGLIETLRQIKDLNLGPGQLREIIPDSEARTAVIALTTNFERLEEAMANATNSSGALEDAYEVMEDTPDTQVRLFRSEMSELAIQIGESVSAGLPLLTLLKDLVKSLNDADFATKFVTASIAGATAGSILWLAGLGKLVSLLGLTSIGMRAAFAGAGSVVAIAGITFAVAKLTDTHLSHLEALNKLEEGEARRASTLFRTEILNRNNADAQALTVSQLQELTDEELAQYEARLTGARDFWRARFEIAVANGLNENDASVQEANRESRAFSQRLRDYEQFVAQRNNLSLSLKNGITAIQAEHSKLAISVKADVEELIAAEEKRASALEQSLAKGVEAETRAAEKIKSLRQELSGIELSTADKVRELRRRDLSEAQQQADIQAQANEKLAASRDALDAGRIGQSRALADQASGLAQQLSNTQAAVRITEEAGEALAAAKEKEIVAARRALAEQKKTNAGIRSELKQTEDTVSSLKEELSSLGDVEASPEVKLEGVKKALSDIDKLKKALDELNRQQASANVGTQRRMNGGPIFASSGTKLSGFGGGDIVDAKLEPGEWIINRFRSRMFDPLLNAINFGSLGDVQNMISQYAFKPHFAIGGVAGSESDGIAQVPTNAFPQDSTRVDISIGGGDPFAIFGQRDEIAGFITALENYDVG